MSLGIKLRLIKVSTYINPRLTGFDVEDGLRLTGKYLVYLHTVLSSLTMGMRLFMLNKNYVIYVLPIVLHVSK